jgi:hypothetical protein
LFRKNSGTKTIPHPPDCRVKIDNPVQTLLRTKVKLVQAGSIPQKNLEPGTDEHGTMFPPIRFNRIPNFEHKIKRKKILAT